MGNKPLGLVILGARIWMHLVVILVISVLLGLLAADLTSFKMFFGAMWAGGFEPNWFGLAVHLGLSAALWGLLVLAVKMIRRRKRQALKLHRVRGSVMVETLIVLFPFLLLTSGVAQYTMLT